MHFSNKEAVTVALQTSRILKASLRIRSLLQALSKARTKTAQLLAQGNIGKNAARFTLLYNRSAQVHSAMKHSGKQLHTYLQKLESMLPDSSLLRNAEIELRNLFRKIFRKPMIPNISIKATIILIFSIRTLKALLHKIDNTYNRLLEQEQAERKLFSKYTSRPHAHDAFIAFGHHVLAARHRVPFLWSARFNAEIVHSAAALNLLETALLAGFSQVPVFAAGPIIGAAAAGARGALLGVLLGILFELVKYGLVFLYIQLKKSCRLRVSDDGAA